jgi:hypothetical protein
MMMMGQQLQQQQLQQNNLQNNGHAAIQSDSDGGGSSDSDSDHSSTKPPKRKRSAHGTDKNLKEKNKEHARNTRLRKKNFIDHLKQTIQDLGRERDEDEMRLRSELTRIATGVSCFSISLIFFELLSLSRWNQRSKSFRRSFFSAPLGKPIWINGLRSCLKTST